MRILREKEKALRRVQERKSKKLLQCALRLLWLVLLLFFLLLCLFAIFKKNLKPSG